MNSSTNVKVQLNGLKYLLNEDEKKASVIDHTFENGIIIIPSTINHNNQEYDVTNISSQGIDFIDGRISIRFADNSKVRTIEKNAFLPLNRHIHIESVVESITIPASLIKLEKKWCRSSTKLNEIKISPNNPKYSLFEGKFIVTKSSPEKENNDVLVFCVRNAEITTIPNFIEIIESYSLSECKRIQLLDIQDDSHLRIIEKDCFSDSSIESFTIPANLIELKEGWCKNTCFLNEIKISSKNQKYSIFENKFIVTKSSPEKENYDVLAFCVRNVENVAIPDSIEVIESYSFQNCNKLTEVSFSLNSKLRIIKKKAFSHSSISCINLPVHVTNIERNSFSLCEDLKSVNFLDNSNLKIIEKGAFFFTSIESITIPKSVTKICEYAFYNCHKLKIVNFSDNSELKVIENGAFYLTPIESITITKSVTKICEYAFADCKNLKSVDISEDSELQVIEKNAFNNSLIEKFYIPSNLTEIDSSFFSLNIKEIEINKNNPKYSIYENKFIVGKSSLDKENYNVLISYLQRDETKEEEVEKENQNSIDEDNGPLSFKKMFMSLLNGIQNDVKQDVDAKVTIPNFIEIIGSYSFNNCKQLKQIEFPEDSKVTVIDDFAFIQSSIEMISIPVNLIRIGKNAFFKCCSLKKVDIPYDSKLSIIDEYAFFGASIESINIPPHLKKISKLTFGNCTKLTKIEIPENSELQAIESNAFNNCAIQSIFVPESLIDLQKGWCQNTKKLNEIRVSKNNPKYAEYGKMFIIEKSSLDKEYFDTLAFCVRSIETPESRSNYLLFDNEEEQIPEAVFDIKVEIPNFIEIIGPCSFEYCHHQANVMNRITITIPPSVTQICERAFSNCAALHNVEIQSDSNLQIIKRLAFNNSSIEYISIPLHLTKICESSFLNCKRLQKVEIPENSELQLIEKFAFSGSRIRELYIPSKLIELDIDSLKYETKIKKVCVDSNNLKFASFDNKFIIGKSVPEKDIYDVLLFCVHNVKKVTIPSFIEIIGPSSFKDQMKLKKVEFPIDSKLSIIDVCAFTQSSIKCISLPRNLSRVCDKAFSFCYYLQIVEFNEKIKIENINLNVFDGLENALILIPCVTNNV